MKFVSRFISFYKMLKKKKNNWLHFSYTYTFCLQIRHFLYPVEKTCNTFRQFVSPRNNVFLNLVVMKMCVVSEGTCPYDFCHFHFFFFYSRIFETFAQHLHQKNHHLLPLLVIWTFFFVFTFSFFPKDTRNSTQ